MLTRRSGLAAMVVLVLCTLVGAPAAHAAQVDTVVRAATSGTTCTVPDQQGGTVTVPCESTGGDPDNPDGPGPGTGGGPRVCETTDGHGGTREVDCVSDDGVWHSGHMCYIQVLDPQPGQSDPVWEGNTDGQIVACTPPPCTGFCRDYAEFWMAAPEAAGPTPRELAERAVARMELFTGEIGSTPPSTAVKPGSMGLIGVPTWFWIDDRGPGTTEDLTTSETAGALTVNVTAELNRVEWTLTDRATGAVRANVTCSGSSAPGTPWSGAVGGDGTVASPTCGLGGGQNDTPGRYTLTAQAYWVATWNGGGESGTIDVTPPAQAVPVDIAELQSIVVD